MIRRLILRRRARRDPGAAWAAAALEPLRRSRLEVDVAGAVMALVLESRRPARVESGTRLAWALTVTAGSAAVVFLLVTVTLLLGGDHGLHVAWGLGRGVLRAAWLLLDGAWAMALACLIPVTRGLVALAEVVAPLWRGAGAAAAVCGALSIPFSAWVFAQARKTAPSAGAHGGTR